VSGETGGGKKKKKKGEAPGRPIRGTRRFRIKHNVSIPQFACRRCISRNCPRVAIAPGVRDTLMQQGQGHCARGSLCVLGPHKKRVRTGRASRRYLGCKTKRHMWRNFSRMVELRSCFLFVLSQLKCKLKKFSAGLLRGGLRFGAELELRVR
jgi:hypothetical protein